MKNIGASLPITVVSIGSVMAGCAAYCGTSICALGFQLPKYLSIVATVSSGFKSPDKQIATLLGT